MVSDYTYDDFGNEISFEGNTNIKRAGTKLSYTEEHIIEWNKCRNDWQYFAENYVYILNLDEGLIKPKIRDYQTEMINNYINNRLNIVLAARQCVDGETKITVKDEDTGEIKNITMKEFYELFAE